MPKFVAFLRAINVGGNNMLPMKSLVDMLSELGFADVRTHLQSGNAVFSAPTMNEVELAELIESAIERRCAFRSTVLIRTRNEFDTVVSSNPLLSQGINPSRLITVFLRDHPARDAILRLDDAAFPGVSYAVVGREMFVRYDEGMGASKFVPAYYERRLGTIGTARNWNTVLKMQTLLHD